MAHAIPSGRYMGPVGGIIGMQERGSTVALNDLRALSLGSIGPLAGRFGGLGGLAGAMTWTPPGGLGQAGHEGHAHAHSATPPPTPGSPVPSPAPALPTPTPAPTTAETPSLNPMEQLCLQRITRDRGTRADYDRCVAGATAGTAAVTGLLSWIGSRRDARAERQAGAAAKVPTPGGYGYPGVTAPAPTALTPAQRALLGQQGITTKKVAAAGAGLALGVVLMALIL